ncbi:MAG: TlpA family protein disulfide reductase [Nannocystaceae bacterium]
MNPNAPAPRQDRIVPGQAYIGEHGVKLPAAFTRVRLEQILPDGSLQPRRAGSRKVLAPKTISVINLWATYCGPCKEELPDFKRVFEQQKHWGTRVRFVPIQLPESRPPATAYAKYGPTMPRSVKFSDRMGGVLEALASPTTREQKLYYESLPVTLVLDCNRRVRWARFSALEQEHFTELTTTIDQLVRELPTRKCQRIECGNGVCELGESEESCSVDCGAEEAFSALKLEPAPEGDSKPTIKESVNPKKPDLQVMPDTQKTVPEIPKLERGCNFDGKCDREQGESSTDCCQDCKCPEGLSCRQAAGDAWLCGEGLLPAD